MPLIDRIRAIQARSPEAFTTFRIAGETVGFIQLELAHDLFDKFRTYFDFQDSELSLKSALSDFQSRSKALEAVSDYFLSVGLMPPPRNEFYPIKNHWNQQPFAQLERNASIPLGLITYGVNLNAWTVNDRGEKLLWVGQRSLHKQTEPGKLDHIAAGGQPAHLGLHENMIKEAQEEASVPPELATNCIPVGAVSGHYHGQHCRRFIHYNFDLELPGDFEPTPLDGEVDNFTLMLPHDVIDTLRTSDDFDLESAVAIIDWLIRHGFIHAENEPDFDEIVTGLHTNLSAIS